MKVIIIAAIAENGIIGDSQKGLPWHLPEEFKHFKATTLGSPIIMGKKTFLELGKPLKGRLNIVLSREARAADLPSEVLQFATPAAAIRHCRESGSEKAFIIGGAQVYAAAIPLATDMILSYLKFPAQGDIHFPDFPLDSWKLEAKEDREQFSIHYYSRKQ